MDNIFDIYGDAIVTIIGILAAFAMLAAVCVTYQDIIMGMLDSIFYK